MKTHTGIEYDQLTGLFSRWHCSMELQKLLDNRENRVYVSIDLDNFKRINSAYGNTMGDKLLKAIANVLCDSLPAAVLCRLSGDEFGYILPPMAYNRREMCLMTRRIFNNLHKLQVEGLEKEQFFFSIGSVFVTADLFKTADEIFFEATKNRLNAKNHDGNFLCSRYGEIPDVEGCFIALKKDRNLYNSINDQLKAVHDEKDWMKYLHEGSVLKESMCRRTQGLIDDILNYYKQGELPEIEYEQLFLLVVNYVKWLDAYMLITFIEDILVPYYESRELTDKVRSYLGHLYLLLGDNLMSVFRMGDLSKRKQINDLFRKSCDITRCLKHDSIQFEPCFYSLCELVSHYENLDEIFDDIEECDRAYEELRSLIIGDDPFRVPDEGVYSHFKYQVDNARLFPIFRACYLLIGKSSHTEKQQAEFVRRLNYIKSHQSEDGVYDLAGDDPDIRKMAWFLQNILFECTDADSILDRLMLALHEIHMIEYGSLSESNIILVAYLFLGASQALLFSNKSKEEKSYIGRNGVDFLIEILKKRQSLATDHQILFLIQVLMRAMLSTNVLSASEKYYYLKQAMAAMMIDTYGHSKAVATYAQIILKNIIDHDPQLLVGNDRIYNSVDELNANRENLLQFMEVACMLHDVGKMSITPITSNAYRRLTNSEFQLIRRHPSVGISFLRLEPAFEIFRPFAQLHHRWFNGLGGYPNVDILETHTKLKVLVDILSICDSLEAATSKIGRNYRNAKTFLQIMDEFMIESGTRYSNEIIQSIISNPETYYSIRQMVDHNWQSVYLHIFQEVIGISDESVDQSNDVFDEIPDLYAHSDQEFIDEAPLSLYNKLSTPEWLRQMDTEALQLYTFSLIEFNRLNIMNDNCVIFRYDVKKDVIDFMYQDPTNNNEITHIFSNHFSEQRLGVFLSKDGYNKAIEVIKRVITEPDFPKEGQQKLEYNDKSLCLLATYTSVVDRNNKVLSIVGRLQDINTTSEKYLQTIHLQNRYLEILDSLTNNLFVVAIHSDIEFKHFDILKGFPKLFEGSKLNNTVEFAHFVNDNIVDDDYKEQFLEFVDHTTLQERLKGKQKLSLEYHSRYSGWLRSHLIPVSYDKDYNVTHLILIAESIEEEHKKTAFLTYAANYDSMTSLMNRTFGEKSIEQEIKKNGPKIFAIFDCDQFKSINDQLSHLVGDKVISGQGHILKEFFSDSLCMRLGGDEFVAYIDGEKARRLVLSNELMLEYFGQLKTKLSLLQIPELENIAPTMSMGIIYASDSTNASFDQFYQQADLALRESKKSRNGAITIYELNI